MSEPTQPGAPEPAPASEPASTPAPEPAAPPSPPSDAPITAREAAELISGRPPETQSSDKDDAAPPQESRSETEAPEPQPEPLEAPRSWPKQEREAFAALTREHQEAFLARDRAREADIQLGLRQAAAQRQAAEAMVQQAEQARQQAEWQTLPEKVLLAEAEYRKLFGTPTEAEVREWAEFDQPRWVRWQEAIRQVTAARTELNQAQYQQAQQQEREQQLFWQKAEAWKNQEAQKFMEVAPEWKDPKTYSSKVADVLDYMQEIGFTRDEVERFATEYVPIQIHDHRYQKMAWDAVRYRKAEQAAKSPQRANVPPVQRPGSAPSRGEASEERFKNLTRQLDRSGSIRDGAALIAARMNGRS